MSRTSTAPATDRPGNDHRRSGPVRRYTRRSALVLGAVAAGSTVVLSRAGSAAAADSPVELGPATLLSRDDGAAPVAPVAPVALVPGYRPSFARWVYSGNSAAAGADRWAWQALQGDRPKPAGTAPVVYVTAVRRPSDPAGITQCLRPDQVPDAWLLRSRTGAPLHRGTDNAGGDQLVDVGNPAFQVAAATALVARCRTQGWGGVYLDELNGELAWGAWDAAAAKYDDAGFRAAQLAFVTVLAVALQAAGLSLTLNIGEAVYRSWCDALTATGATLSAEFFVAGSGGASGCATRENGGWSTRVDWLEATLAARPHVVVHEMQVDPARVGYGLASFLLVDNGRGAYGASTEYSASAPWLSLYTDAQALGSPVGARTEITPGLWRRDFEHGYVLVNCSGAATTYAGAAVPAVSGRIVAA